MSSVRVLSIRRFLVSGFLAERTQQIHSLRASGVISSHAACAAGSEPRTSRKSAGNLCMTPLASCLAAGRFSVWAIVLIDSESRGVFHRLIPRLAPFVQIVFARVSEQLPARVIEDIQALVFGHQRTIGAPHARTEIESHRTLGILCMTDILAAGNEYL